VEGGAGRDGREGREGGTGEEGGEGRSTAGEKYTFTFPSDLPSDLPSDPHLPVTSPADKTFEIRDHTPSSPPSPRPAAQPSTLNLLQLPPVPLGVSPASTKGCTTKDR